MMDQQTTITVVRTFCKSARDTSITRPLSPSEAICEQQVCCNARVVCGCCGGKQPHAAAIQPLQPANTRCVMHSTHLGAGGAGDERLAHVADLEHGWSLDFIPVLLAKGVHTVRGVGTCVRRSTLGHQGSCSHGFSHYCQIDARRTPSSCCPSFPWTTACSYPPPC